MKKTKLRAVKRDRQFGANLVQVRKNLISLVEAHPKKRGHALVIYFQGHPLFVVDGKDNARCAHDVDTVELTDTSLRVIYARRRGPYTGKTQLKSVQANFKATKTQLTRMQQLLATLGDDDGHEH